MAHDFPRIEMWNSSERPGRSANEQKIGDYYATCMDESAIEQTGAKPLDAEFRSIATSSRKMSCQRKSSACTVKEPTYCSGSGSASDSAFRKRWP
jgi:predicted metalloendopeptidase